MLNLVLFLCIDGGEVITSIAKKLDIPIAEARITIEYLLANKLLDTRKAVIYATTDKGKLLLSNAGDSE